MPATAARPGHRRRPPTSPLTSVCAAGEGKVVMAPVGRQRVRSIKRSNGTKDRINNMVKKRLPLQRGGNSRLEVSYLYRFKFMRFLSLWEIAILRQKKSKKEGQKADLIKNMSPKVPKEGRSTTCFWRDPNSKFCIICGDDKEAHLELKCPYNYLSPATYVPCRARLALWGNYTTTLRYKCLRHREEEMREPPTHDEMNSKRLEFMRCLVRVNNLPRHYNPEQFATLFRRFGRLRMWHIAMRSSGACKGYGCVVFQHREHAEEAIDALNSYEVCECKLRVDWAYPSLNYC